MKVGDLVITNPLLGGDIAIVVEPYDAPKKLWTVFWIKEGIKSLCHEKNIEVLNESR